MIKTNLELIKTSLLEISRHIPDVRERQWPIFLVEMAGAIGSGKSETVNELRKIFNVTEESGKLFEDFGVTYIYEDIVSAKTTSAIRSFYEGGMDGDELENIICSTRINNLLTTLRNLSDDRPWLVISDRSIEEDCPFIEDLYKKTDDCFTRVNLQHIKNLIKCFVQQMSRIDSAIVHCVVYLETEPEEALNRIRKRGRPSESQINIQRLGELTLPIKDVQAGTVCSINNTNMSAKYTALICYMLICQWLEHFGALDDIPKLLVSFYGVPGVGKTTLMNAVWRELSYCSDKIQDRSDEPVMMEEQRKVYEQKYDKMSPDKIQNMIDERRLCDYYNVCEYRERVGAGARVPLFFVTDVGPYTSYIFRNVTGCEQNDTYEKETEKYFTRFLNVVVQPKHGDLSLVVEAIKQRGRPGEISGLNTEYLQRVSDEIDFTMCDVVRVENDYTQDAKRLMTQIVMEAIYDAIVGNRSGLENKRIRRK